MCTKKLITKSVKNIELLKRYQKLKKKTFLKIKDCEILYDTKIYTINQKR